MLTEELPLYTDMVHGGAIRASAMTENIVLLRYVETNSALLPDRLRSSSSAKRARSVDPPLRHRRERACT